MNKFYNNILLDGSFIVNIQQDIMKLLADTKCIYNK